MSNPEAASRGGRETRLLLVTIAVSVGVLLLLARFRFPDESSSQAVESAPAPLERLAARVAYDELATIMADLERRLTPRVSILRTEAPGNPESLVIAPRVTPDRAVAVMLPDRRVVSADTGAAIEVIARDAITDMAIVRVPAMDDSAVAIRQGTPRAGPRYVGVVEATASGPAVRPLYVGRADVSQDPSTGAQLWTLSGLQHQVRRGAAIFTLEGAFIGLVIDAGEQAVVLGGEYLRAAAERAQPSDEQPGSDFGIEVDSLTAVLARVTGADRGVVVTHVRPSGRARGLLQPGDVIQAVNGTSVSSPATFRAIERERPPGTAVSITGLRRRSPLEISLNPVDPAGPTAPAVEGAGFIGRAVAGAGIEVVTVSSRSPAALAGLQAGDLIVTIDGDEARDTASLERRFRSSDAGVAILLGVTRGQQHRIIALEKR